MYIYEPFATGHSAYEITRYNESKPTRPFLKLFTFYNLGIYILARFAYCRFAATGDTHTTTEKLLLCGFEISRPKKYFFHYPQGVLPRMSLLFRLCRVTINM